MRLFFLSGLVIILISGCSEPVESVLLQNDTQSVVEITFNNVTIAATEQISISPGEAGRIALKGIWSTDSVEKIGKMLREYVVIRFLRGKNGTLELRGDQALMKLAGNLSREDDSWVVNMSDIFGAK
jgi:hypothetical protein